METVMKVWIGSDLHIEFPENKDIQISAGDADIAILAGDISEGVTGIEWAAETFDIPVIYVSGNHEYYYREFHEHTENMRERANSLGVHFLERDTVKLGDFTFAGCTLWTDYDALNDIDAGMETAASVMADHRLIRNVNRGFSPEDARAIHKQSVDWLWSLSPVDVVITHHSPSLLGIGDRHPLNAYTPAFTSRLDELISHLIPSAWIFGHTHDSVSRIHACGTQIVSNQLGYPTETTDETGWNPDFILDLPGIP